MIRELLNGVLAVPKAHRFLYRLSAVIEVVRRVGAALVTVEDTIVDEPLEDALGGLV